MTESRGPSRLIIIVNSDLNMSAGLMSAQVSHVSELVGYNAARAMSDLTLGMGLEGGDTGGFRGGDTGGLDVLEYEYWRTNPITIIKRAPLAAIIRFIQEFGTKKIRFELFRDSVPGLIPDNTITCLAIYPGQQVPAEIDELGLA